MVAAWQRVTPSEVHQASITCRRIGCHPSNLWACPRREGSAGVRDVIECHRLPATTSEGSSPRETQYAGLVVPPRFDRLHSNFLTARDPAVRHFPSKRSSAGSDRALDFLIGMILTDSICGPDCGRDPTDQGNLQNKTHDPRDRTTDREKGKPGQQDSDQQAHALKSRNDQRYPYLLTTSGKWR
jgi:hypothetical protein